MTLSEMTLIAIITFGYWILGGLIYVLISRSSRIGNQDHVRYISDSSIVVTSSIPIGRLIAIALLPPICLVVAWALWQ